MSEQLEGASIVSDEERSIVNYTIISQSKEIARLNEEVEQWKAEARRRSELATHNQGILENEITRLKGELSQIENIVKEALKQDA